MVNPLQKDKVVEWSKLKPFADNKILNRNSFWDRKETLWEKEKMLVTSIFSFFQNVFKKFLFQGH